MILKRLLIVVFVIAIICCQENFSFGQIPTPVNVDTISIINNKAFITWIPKNDGITVRYVIHRSGWEKTSNYYIPYKDTLGPIIGINNDHYTDDSKNPCDSSFTYTVQAINDFGNTDQLSSVYKGFRGRFRVKVSKSGVEIFFAGASVINLAGVFF